MSNPKDAYISLTNGNIAGLEENVEEYLTVLAEENEDDVEALRSIVTETLKFLAAQRKIDGYLHDNVAQPTAEDVDYSLEVAESIGLTDSFSVKVIAVPQEVAYREALDIIYAGE